MNLYRYNRLSGIWDQQRTVAIDTANEWLAKFQRDEPEESFRVSRNTPIGPPRTPPRWTEHSSTPRTATTYVLRPSPEPYSSTGIAWNAFYADGRPRFLGEETRGKLVETIMSLEPDAIIVADKKESPKVKKVTFAQARAALQAALRAAGWTLSPPYNPQGRPYKVPYATSPNGVVRLWFKTEAVYAGVLPFDLAQAHSACSDMRELDPEHFASSIEEEVVRWNMRMRELDRR
jgi:hypothetical protein